MPRRRRLASAVSGMGEALSDAMQMMLSDRLITRRQREWSEQAQNALLARQLLEDFTSRTAALEDPAKVAELGPERVMEQYRLARRRLPKSLQQFAGEEPDFTRLDAPVSTRVAPVRKRILDATAPSGVPSQMSIEGLMRSEGRADAGQSPDAFAELERLTQESGLKRAGLERELPRTARTRIGAGGTQVTDYLTAPELAELGEVRTERTPEEEATRQANIRRATAQADVDVANDPQNIRGFASRTEAEAYARQKGGLRADQQMGAGSFAPQYEIKEEMGPGGTRVYRIIDKRGGGARELPGGIPAEQQTDAMRQSFSFADRAVASHNRLMQLEPVLKDRGLAVSWMQVNTPEAITDPVVRQYLQAVRENINAQARRESGAAISEVEMNRYIATQAWKPGDDDQTLKNKWDSRRRVAQGLALQSGERLGSMFTSVAELKALPSSQGRSDQDIIREAEASGYRVIR